MIYPKISKFPTCWEDGMKLSAKHFQHLEDSIEDAMRDNRALSLGANKGFGLLPFSSLEIRNAQGTGPHSVRVILESCRAVLPGGYRVEILPENIERLKIPSRKPSIEFAPSPNIRYHLFLTVSENKRKPAGIPETRPIRHPYLSLDYNLECIANDKLSAVRNLAANRMKIAEWQNGKIIEGYIPATMTIQGFPLLEKWHKFLHNQLENMVRISLQVIKEHRKKDVARANFCTPIVQHIRSSQGYFKWILPNQSPIHLVAFFADLAGLVDSLIETSDRDFVRNMLKDGKIKNLRPTLHELLKLQVPPVEEMAIVIIKMQKICSAIISTLQSLITYTPPAHKIGDQNRIISG